MSTFPVILNDLKQQKYAPIYFLHGEEPYFIDIVSKYIEDNALNEEEKGFNQTIIYGRDANVDDIILSARRPPMMAPFQIIIVKEAQQLKRIEDFEKYFNKPLETTILVICHKYKKADKRKKYLKAAMANGVVFESVKLYESQIPKWIQDYTQSKGIKIAPHSTVLLSEFLGNNLQKITNEIDKLELIVEKGVTITPEIIEENIGISKDFNVFELQKALATKNAFKAFQIAKFFGENSKNHPIFQTLPALARFFNLVLTIQYAKNKNPKELSRVIGVNPYFIDDYLHASKAYSALKVTEIIHEIKIADLKSKGVDSGYLPEKEILKELIYKILN